MKLTEKQVRELKKGSVIYYHEYSPAEEKTTFDDILVLTDKSGYTPKFKVLASKMGGVGEAAKPAIFEISNGRAYAIPDKDFIIKLLFEKDLW